MIKDSRGNKIITEEEFNEMMNYILNKTFGKYENGFLDEKTTKKDWDSYFEYWQPLIKKICEVKDDK